MAGETVRIIGLDDIMARFKALPGELKKGPIRKSSYAATKVIRDEVVKNVPVWKGNKFAGNNGHIPGLLKESIGIFRDRDPAKFDAAEVYHVGTRRLTKRYANTAKNRRYYRVGKKYKISGAAYYAMFVEWGTKTTGLGRPGQDAKRPFGKAYEATKQQAVSTFTQTLSTDIDKVVTKLAKQKATGL